MSPSITNPTVLGRLVSLSSATKGVMFSCKGLPGTKGPSRPNRVMRSRLLRCDPANLNLRMRAEVHQQAELVSSGLEIVHDLGDVLFVNLAHGLELDNNLAVADKIRHIQPAIAVLVEYVQLLLGIIRDAAKPQFFFQSVLVDLFKIARAQGLVNLVDGTANRIRLLFVDQDFIHNADYTTNREVCDDSSQRLGDLVFSPRALADNDLAIPWSRAKRRQIAQGLARVNGFRHPDG